jgi:hypothetical protein
MRFAGARRMSTLCADRKTPPVDAREGRGADDKARLAHDRPNPRPAPSEPNDVVELYNLPFTD